MSNNSCNRCVFGKVVQFIQKCVDCDKSLTRCNFTRSIRGIRLVRFAIKDDRV